MNYAFSYRAAASFEEALEALRDGGPDTRVLAGGTDLLVNVRAGLLQPTTIIDLKRIPHIQTCSDDPADGLSIGAAVTINALMAAEPVRTQYPILWACARQLASHQVRNRATVVGNIVNASPCADMAPALISLDAELEIRALNGTRLEPCADFFTGPKQTRLQPGEMVSRIRIPAAWRGHQGGYHKLKRIQGHDLGIVGVACVKQGEHVRLAISSAAPTPVRVQELRATDTVDDAIAAAQAAIKPIDDVRCSREYRLFMVSVYIRRLWQQVVSGTGPEADAHDLPPLAPEASSPSPPPPLACDGQVRVMVNGEIYERTTTGHQTLLHFLRESIGLTGTKEGCAAGECGACTVILNGQAVNSCLVLAAEVDGAVIETVEAEGQNGALSPLQTAFERNHGTQCGFCTPGMLMSVRDLLRRNPRPTVPEIKAGIEGNFCRCTGYVQIIEAVLDATGQSERKGGLQHV